MALAYTKTDVSSGFNPTQINVNWTNITTALTDGLSRSGNGPNAMAANLDMGTNDIINADNITVTTEITVGGVGIAAQVAAAAVSAAAALASENNAATSESNAATSETNAGASATLASQWASLTGALVAATDYSAKEYAIGTFTRGSVGSAKDWATLTGTTVNATEVSAREWARGTYNVGLANGGSARMWATQAEDVLVDDTGYSAFHWAQKAMAIVGGVAGLVSSNDTTADYLLNKFTALHGLTWTELNDGANEDLQISVGSHLEIGGGANNYELNVYTGDSLETVAHFTNLTTGNTSADGTKVGINSAEQAVLWNYENTATLFGVNNDEKMRITNNGNLLFDTTTDAASYRIRCHDAATSGAQYIRFGNTTTGTLTSRGIVIGMNASEQMVLENHENTDMIFHTNSSPRFKIGSDGGIYTNGATGGSQGADTVNASNYYKDGTEIAVHRGCLVYLDASQTIATATNDDINFDQESYDTDGIHDNVTNNNRLTVPTGVTKVRLHAQVNFDASGTGRRQVQILKGSSGLYVGRAYSNLDATSAGGAHSVSVSTPVLTVTGGNFFTLDVYHTHGSNLDVYGDANGNTTWFEMEIIE